MSGVESRSPGTRIADVDRSPPEGFARGEPELETDETGSHSSLEPGTVAELPAGTQHRSRERRRRGGSGRRRERNRAGRERLREVVTGGVGEEIEPPAAIVGDPALLDRARDDAASREGAVGMAAQPFAPSEE